MINILIYNYNSLHWLNICVTEIRRHTKEKYHILIADQSENPTPVDNFFHRHRDVTVYHMEARGCGYGLQWILDHVKITSEYLVTMECDAFPVSDQWISTPIRLLNEFDLTWVGLRAEIESYYKKHYFHMGTCWKVGRTKDYHLAGPSYANSQGFDNTVQAQVWEDENYQRKKLSLPVTGRVGITPTEGEYGRLIGNLVMHFCLSYTSTLHASRKAALGKDYLLWEQCVMGDDPGIAAQKIMAAVNYSRCLQPLQYWNGTDHEEPPEQIRKAVRYLTHRRPHLSIPLHEVINEYYDVIGVIHIGAHTGQEWSDYDDNDITNVMMFEPLRSAFDKLRDSVPDHVECYCTALGNYTGVATLHTETANEGMSSSVLQPTKHLEQYPDITFDGEELIHMERLDDIPFDRSRFNMLNIDVQGYEMEVLKGAKETLRHIDVIYCEVSNEPLYDGAPLVGEIDSYLSGYDRVRTEWIGGNWGEAVYVKK